NALSQDEVASARILREPTLPAALHRVVHTESTPPLWYSLAWLCHHAGVPIVDTRLLSVAVGAGLAVAVYLLAEALLPRWAALAAAGLVAVGYEPVYHGAELRSYELLALLSALLGLVLLRRRAGLALAAIVWAGLLTHYFFVYSVAAALAWLWLDPAARALRRRATLSIAAGAALAAPWLPAFLVQLHNDRFWWIKPFSARVVAVTPLRLFVPFRFESLPLALAVLALAAAGALLPARASADGRLLGALAFGPLVLAACVWAAGERDYAVRNLIEIAPFLAVAGAAALAALPRPAALAAAAASVAAVAAAAVPQATLLPPYQQVARTLVSEGWHPSDPIAVFGNVFSFRAPLEWYLPHNPLLDVSHATDSECSALFVIVRAEGRGKLPADVESSRRAGDFLVARLDDVRAATLRRATVLAPLRRAPRCVQPSHNPRLEPLS
ncbi:MAG TPA: glycosyltransferase family 39 protein, partial [Gaiellaceae bacterium]|nr:glycosyltransferase family 39 protein [Gaiellaceae bacterium]